VASGRASAQEEFLGPSPLPEPSELLESESEPEDVDLLVLPPITTDARGVPGSLLRVTIRSVEIVGSTAFDESDFEPIARPFLDRPLGTEQLTALVNEVTRLYASAGFLTSRAILPDQDLESDRLVVQVIEDRLDKIEIIGARAFRESYFKRRLRRAAGFPLNATALASKLEVLQRDDRIDRVEAVLEETTGGGSSTLRVVVHEAFPIDLSFHFDNHRASSVGIVGGGGLWRHSNLLGIGDELTLRYDGREGLQDGEVGLMLPVSTSDTLLSFRYRRSASRIVEPAFDDLDIRGDLESVEIELAQPLSRSRRFDSSIALVGEWRRSKSTLDGRVFCFQAEVTDCRPTVSVLRLRYDASLRRQRSALAARSTFSVGLDVLGATQAKGSREPDGSFAAWVGQIQWLQRPPSSLGLPRILDASWLISTAVIQLTPSRLLALERIALGGAGFVRGYRQSLLVRDNGFFGSLEGRIPVLRDAFGRAIIQGAPFFDVARGWNTRDGDSGDTLSSVGIGMVVTPHPRIQGSLYWGYRLTDQPKPHDDLQRHGIHFRITWNAI
jgi:hemolysin activation/secretion protein